MIERPLPGKSADSQVAPSAERAQPEGPSVLVENKDAEGNESDNSEDERYIRRVVVPHVCTMRGKDQRGLLPTQGMSAAIELSESDSSDDEDLDYVSSDGGLLAGRYWRDGHSLGKGWRIWKRAASI